MGDVSQQICAAPKLSPLPGAARPWLVAGTVVVMVLLSGAVGASERQPVERVYPVVAPGVRPPAPSIEALPLGLELVEHAPAATSLVLGLPTHIGFYEGLEIISEVSGDRFSYRVEGSAGKGARLLAGGSDPVTRGEGAPARSRLPPIAAAGRRSTGQRFRRSAAKKIRAVIETLQRETR